MYVLYRIISCIHLYFVSFQLTIKLMVSLSIIYIILLSFFALVCSIGEWVLWFFTFFVPSVVLFLFNINHFSTTGLVRLVVNNLNCASQCLDWLTRKPCGDLHVVSLRHVSCYIYTHVGEWSQRAVYSKWTSKVEWNPYMFGHFVEIQTIQNMW